MSDRGRQFGVSWGFAVLAGLLYAIALKYFVFPAGVILTGTEGIAVSISYFVDRAWVFIVLYMVFQAGLLVFAYRRIGRGFALRSLVVILTVIVGLSVLPGLQFAQPEPQNERLILVLFGGILSGVAKAIAFRNRGSTGDEDVVAAYYALKYMKPVGSIAVIAAIVSTAFGLGLQWAGGGDFPMLVNTLMYTCVYIFASAETLNNLYRKFRLTMVVTITEKPEHVGAIIKSAAPHRTYTVQPGVGGHTKGSYSMVRTIITHEELPALISRLGTEAPGSFYYYHDVEGVSGKYYISPIG
jgi:uncharacterized membrane-anchored protein YitT (DUF2179 family)